MQAPQHRKVELQSSADLAYLYANTVALSRQKLDLHFPPSANESDPMKERVRELVDEFITTTYTTAIPSISINGLDTSTSTGAQQTSKSKSKSKSSKTGSSADPPDLSVLQSLLSTRESVEYEPYDAALASRVSALYAQLESLTTTVAQMRRDAPARAARAYADALDEAVAGDEREEGNDGEDEQEDGDDDGAMDTGGAEQDMNMDDRTNAQQSSTKPSTRKQDWKRQVEKHPEWALQVVFGSGPERERWHDGEMSEVYADALRTLARLQGEVGVGLGSEDGLANPDDETDGEESLGLATTVGKVERARMAAEVVEKMG